MGDVVTVAAIGGALGLAGGRLFGLSPGEGAIGGALIGGVGEAISHRQSPNLPATYGADNAAAGAAVGQAVGTGMAAAAGLANVIIQGQNDPFQVGREFSRKFERGVQNLRSLEAEYTRFRDQHENAVAWLTHPANKKAWMSGAAAMRIAPPDSRLCPPIYVHGVGRAAVGEEAAPGGHAWGDTSCRCPTHKCAYKDQVRGMVDDKKRIARESEGKMERILTSRGLGLGAYLGGMDVARTGNLTQGRGTVQGVWSVLMSLDSLAPLYIMSGAQAPPRPPNLITQDTLTLLYPDDEDAQEGRVPISIRDSSLSTALSLYGMGGVPAPFTLPLWVYGFSSGEARRYGVGPNIAQIATVQARGTRGQSVAGRVAQLIESGQMDIVPQSAPDVIPQAQIDEFEQNAGRGTGLSLAAQLGIGTAIVGALALTVILATGD